MEYLLWICVILSFIVAMIGLLFPIIPSVLFLWLGFIIYHFWIGDVGLSSGFWWGMAFLTLILFIADYISNLYFIKKYGGSKASGWAGTIGLILGSFIFPPFGLIIVPFILVTLVEMLQRRDGQTALKVAFGSVVGFLGSSIAKFVIQMIMIIWFFVQVV